MVFEKEIILIVPLNPKDCPTESPFRTSAGTGDHILQTDRRGKTYYSQLKSLVGRTEALIVCNLNIIKCSEFLASQYHNINPITGKNTDVSTLRTDIHECTTSLIIARTT
jgi:hypothetical protein